MSSANLQYCSTSLHFSFNFSAMRLVTVCFSRCSSSCSSRAVNFSSLASNSCLFWASLPSRVLDSSCSWLYFCSYCLQFSFHWASSVASCSWLLCRVLLSCSCSFQASWAVCWPFLCIWRVSCSCCSGSICRRCVHSMRRELSCSCRRCSLDLVLLCCDVRLVSCLSLECSWAVVSANCSLTLSDMACSCSTRSLKPVLLCVILCRLLVSCLILSASLLSLSTCCVSDSYNLSTSYLSQLMRSFFSRLPFSSNCIFCCNLPVISLCILLISDTFSLPLPLAASSSPRNESTSSCRLFRRCCSLSSTCCMSLSTSLLSCSFSLFISPILSKLSLPLCISWSTRSLSLLLSILSWAMVCLACPNSPSALSLPSCSLSLHSSTLLSWFLNATRVCWASASCSDSSKFCREVSCWRLSISIISRSSLPLLLCSPSKMRSISSRSSRNSSNYWLSSSLSCRSCCLSSLSCCPAYLRVSICCSDRRISSLSSSRSSVSASTCSGGWLRSWWRLQLTCWQAAESASQLLERASISILTWSFSSCLASYCSKARLYFSRHSSFSPRNYSTRSTSPSSHAITCGSRTLTACTSWLLSSSSCLRVGLRGPSGEEGERVRVCSMVEIAASISSHRRRSEQGADCCSGNIFKNSSCCPTPTHPHSNSNTDPPHPRPQTPRRTPARPARPWGRGGREEGPGRGVGA